MKTTVQIEVEVEALDANLPTGRQIMFLTSPQVIAGQVYAKAVEQLRNDVSDEAYEKWLATQ